MSNRFIAETSIAESASPKRHHRTVPFRFFGSPQWFLARGIVPPLLTSLRPASAGVLQSKAGWEETPNTIDRSKCFQQRLTKVVFLFIPFLKRLDNTFGFIIWSWVKNRTHNLNEIYFFAIAVESCDVRWGALSLINVSYAPSMTNICFRASNIRRSSWYAFDVVRFDEYKSGMRINTNKPQFATERTRVIIWCVATGAWICKRQNFYGNKYFQLLL